MMDSPMDLGMGVILTGATVVAIVVPTMVVILMLAPIMVGGIRPINN